MTMASNPLLPWLPVDASRLKMLAKQTAELIVGAMVIASVEADLIPDVIVLEDVSGEASIAQPRHGYRAHRGQAAQTRPTTPASSPWTLDQQI